MEFNRSSKEQFHQTGQSSDDVHSQVSGHVRSYTCTFCKRGFSNAQALGGHMNIHRKDRAKLKELSESSQALNLDDSSSRLESSEEKSGSPKQPWVFSNDDDEVSRGGQEGGAGEVKQLALFVDKHQSPSQSKNGAEEKSKELSQGSSRDQELDLELRLGLEHHER